MISVLLISDGTNGTMPCATKGFDEQKLCATKGFDEQKLCEPNILMNRCCMQQKRRLFGQIFRFGVCVSHHFELNVHRRTSLAIKKHHIEEFDHELTFSPAFYFRWSERLWLLWAALWHLKS